MGASLVKKKIGKHETAPYTYVVEIHALFALLNDLFANSVNTCIPSSS